MSYIRCLSNPECLYVWEESGGKIAISVGTKDVEYVKKRNWHSILRQFLEDWREEHYSGTLSLKEEAIPRETPNRMLDWKWYAKEFFYILFKWNDKANKTVKARWAASKKVHALWSESNCDYKWILRDGNRTICEMWLTTIYTIAKSNEYRWKKPKRK
jgi:hypothetical protein